MPAQKQHPPQAELGHLLGHYRNGRYGDAEKLGRSITQRFPHHQLSWKILGATLNQAQKLQESLIPNQRAVDLDPTDAEAHIILGSTLQQLGRLEQAEASYKKAIALQPGSAAAHYCLGTTLHDLGRTDDAEVSYRNSLALNPNVPGAYISLGILLRHTGRSEEAEPIYRRAIALKPDLAEAHYNLGVTLQELGRLDDAEGSFRKAIALKPEYADAHLYLGHVLGNCGRLEDAKASYKKAIEVKPDNALALWFLSGTAEDIPEAKFWIGQCLAIDQNLDSAKLTNAALNFYQGDKADFINLMQSDAKDHFLMRSFSWVFSLPKLPSLYFHRWAFYDAVVEQSIRSRPFYEFGVWRGESFKYLIKTFNKGYGFDTFTGLPEDWHVGNGKYEKAGAYSSNGEIPKIEGAEFIAGRFEDTLPIFFSEPRPLASVINFDADLYSSTIFALNQSKSVMDKDTVLIFDELIAHECWEENEFKALNEFVAKNKLAYEVIAISFFTKQVAVKLIGI
ncbi:MAG: tetratricopeptide repeat protein [Pseudolabrys sp.]